ncbi:MAG: rRNA maturation RNase YbeY [Bdellovibrio sp.]|nr:rRNA maturation RNase YbeY [Bdellovibrio sp.]
MKITVVNQTDDKINSKRLSHALSEVLESLQQKKLRNKKNLTEKKEITFVFLPTDQMKAINTQYRGKKKPTDVLSFASVEPDSLGELLFCLPVLKKQAKLQKHSLDHELLYMMIHGVLHLLGYDHEVSKKEEKLMFQIQDSCFEHVRHLPRIF